MISVDLFDQSWSYHFTHVQPGAEVGLDGLWGLSEEFLYGAGVKSCSWMVIKNRAFQVSIVMGVPRYSQLYRWWALQSTGLGKLGASDLRTMTGWWFFWNMTGWFFHKLGMSSSQLTNSYFWEGLKPPTRYSWGYLDIPAGFIKHG